MNFVRSEQLVLGVGDDGSIVNEEKKIEKTLEEKRKMRVLEMPEFRKYRSTLADRGEFDPEEDENESLEFLKTEEKREEQEDREHLNEMQAHVRAVAARQAHRDYVADLEFEEGRRRLLEEEEGQHHSILLIGKSRRKSSDVSESDFRLLSGEKAAGKNAGDNDKTGGAESARQSETPRFDPAEGAGLPDSDEDPTELKKARVRVQVRKVAPDALKNKKAGAVIMNYSGRDPNYEDPMSWNTDNAKKPDVTSKDRSRSRSPRREEAKEEQIKTAAMFSGYSDSE